MNVVSIHAGLVSFAFVSLFSSTVSAQPPGGGGVHSSPPALEECNTLGCYVPIADTDSCQETYGPFDDAPSFSACPDDTACNMMDECVNSPEYHYQKVAEADWEVERAKFDAVFDSGADRYRCKEWKLHTCYRAKKCVCVMLNGSLKCATATDTTTSESLGFYYMIRNQAAPCNVP